MNSLKSDILNPVKDSNIIYYGPVYTTTGYGSVSRYYVTGLINAGVKIKVIPFGLPEKDKIDKKTVRMLEEAEQIRIDPKLKNIVILHSTPSGWKNLKIKGADYVIGMTIFETDKIPSLWTRICNAKWINEIWLPSKFNINSFSKSGVSKYKLRLMHYCIDATRYKPIKNKTSDKFRFTYIADFGQRKNLSLLLAAFSKEFSSNDHAELFIHTTSNNKLYLNKFLKDNESFLKNTDNIIINTDKMSDTELIKLISNSDIYISVDKANGWGMPCMEAMALGTPTATVNWSGSTEFMFKSNSFLIEPSGLELVDPISALNQPYYIGQKWATVKTETVRKVLRKAYSENKKLRILGNKGRKTIIDNFDTPIITKEFINALNNIKVKKQKHEQFSLNRDFIKMLINQIVIMVHIQILYLKTYKSLKLTTRIISRWIHLRPIFY